MTFRVVDDIVNRNNRNTHRVQLFFSVCQPCETDSDPNSSGMFVAYATWMYFLNKYSDFADTFFFIAKKKFNQVIMDSILS